MNKYLITDRSKLLTGKLDLLTKKLQSSLATAEIQTQEGYLLEAIKVLQEFYKDLNEPLLGTEDALLVRADDLPDPETFNLIWNKILDDLILLFTELENIELLTVSNFNFATTEANRLTARLKKVASLVGDYILYSSNPNKDSIYFKDSFNDLSKIDQGSNLLNSSECEVNQIEGVVTLPIDRDKITTIAISKTPIINTNSNGQPGNNHQLNAKFNGDLKVVLDNNPDTWFEYEYVTSQKTPKEDPLVLDFTVTLDTEEIINFIKLNPNNFGTKTVLKVEVIETSIDGKIFTSVKDDIPIAGFSVNEENDTFVLAPSTSKFAGQGLYSFTPRKTKYVHIVLSQSEPYIITTTAGDKLRYAIGLRDVSIENIKYKNKGELISKNFELVDEVKKLLLEVNQYPADLNNLTEISWLISPDNGTSWHEIQPKNLDYSLDDIPEILNFNSAEVDAVFTSVPVTSLKVKMILERKDEAFTESNTSLHKAISNKSELHLAPNNSPFTFELEESPIANSISIVDPLFGSRGLPEYQYILGHASGKANQQKFYLPFQNLPRPIKKSLISGKWEVVPQTPSEWIHITVGGEEWTQASAALSTYTSNYESLSIYRLYNLDPIKGILEFGNGINTLAPAADTPIGIWFEAEKLSPTADPDHHLAILDFPTSDNKDNFVLKRYEEPVTTTEILSRKSTILHLLHQNLTDITSLEDTINNLLLTLTGTLGSKKTYLNGQSELTANHHWSINAQEGIIYLRIPTPDNEDITVQYKYQDISVLALEDWEWDSSDRLKKSIIIKDSGWQTRTIESESIPVVSLSTVFDLSQLNVVANTVSFELLENGVAVSESEDSFFKEVDFINGLSEFGYQKIKTTESIPLLVSGLNVFTLKEKIIEDSEDIVLFSNTSLFNTLVSWNAPNAPGEYAIETTPGTNYGKIQVWSNQNVNSSSTGNVTYYYSSSAYSNTGLYSIDYSKGKVYCQKPLDPNSTGSWTLDATYEYTDYRAEYRIARILPESMYNIDLLSKTIAIKESEILKLKNLPLNNLQTNEQYYLINYDYVLENRENIIELKDSFSPIVKDYALRVLTKGKLF